MAYLLNCRQPIQYIFHYLQENSEVALIGLKTNFYLIYLDIFFIAFTILSFFFFTFRATVNRIEFHV